MLPKQIPFEKIGKENFRFVDKPIYHDISSYNETINLFIEELSKLEDINSVYQIGEVTVPGISDLDFIVILNNKLERPQKCIKVIRSYVKKNNYLIEHYPYIINKENFSNVNYMFPIFNIKNIYGEKYKIKKIVDIDILNAIILTDLVNIYWPKEFIRYFLYKKVYLKNKIKSYYFNDILRTLELSKVLPYTKLEIPTRNLLCRLNSMKYPVAMIEKISGQKNRKWSDHINEINDLRKNWFSYNDKKYYTLLDLTKNTIMLCYDIIERLDSILKRKKFFSYEGLEDTLIIERDSSNLYIDNWRPEDSLKKAVNIYKSTGEIVSVLPKNFLVPMLFFPIQGKVICRGPLSTESVKFQNKKYETMLSKRYILLEDQIKFLNTNKFWFESFIHFDYPYKAKRYYRVYLKINKVIRTLKLKGIVHK